MKKVKIKRIKDNKRRTVNIKRTEINNGLRKIKVNDMGQFYAKYMKGIPFSPDQYINSLCVRIDTVHYHMHLIYDLDERHTLMKKGLRKDVVNTFYDIFANTSYGKLKHLGVIDFMYRTAKELLEILEYLKVEAGVKIDFKFTLNDLRDAIYMKSFFVASTKEYKRRNRYAVIGKSGRLIYDDNSEIKLNKLWKGSKIMLEYSDNMWITIPYGYYKRLHNLKKIKVQCSLVIDDSQDELYTIDKTLCTVKDIIIFMINYRDMWTGFNVVNASEWMNIWERRMKITVYKSNGKIEEMDHYHFFSYYCEFLGV